VTASGTLRRRARTPQIRTGESHYVLGPSVVTSVSSALGNHHAVALLAFQANYLCSVSVGVCYNHSYYITNSLEYRRYYPPMEVGGQHPGPVVSAPGSWSLSCGYSIFEPTVAATKRWLHWLNANLPGYRTTSAGVNRIGVERSADLENLDKGGYRAGNRVVLHTCHLAPKSNLYPSMVLQVLPGSPTSSWSRPWSSAR